MEQLETIKKALLLYIAATILERVLIEKTKWDAKREQDFRTTTPLSDQAKFDADRLYKWILQDRKSRSRHSV